MNNHDRPISKKDIYYYRQRYRNRVFSAVARLFSERAKTEGLSKKELAFRLGKEPAQITRWFSGPSNWTLDTVSDLLLAMGAEFDHTAGSFQAASSRKCVHPLVQEIDDEKKIIKARARLR